MKWPLVVDHEIQKQKAKKSKNNKITKSDSKIGCCYLYEIRNVHKS